MTRLAQAQALRNKLSVKNVDIPQINQFIEQIQKQVPDLKKHEEKFNKELSNFNAESTNLKNLITSLRQNPTDKKIAKQCKEKEDEIMKIAYTITSIDQFMFSIGEKCFEHYTQGGNLLLAVDSPSISNDLETRLNEAKNQVQVILNNVNGKIDIVKNFAETNDLKRINNALKVIETDLKEKLPPASEYYIYQKQNVWYIDKVSQDDIVVLKNSGVILLRNITKEEYNTCGVIAKFPKNAFDNVQSFMSAISNGEFQFNGSTGATYSETYSASDGTTVGLTAQHQEDIKVILKFNDILLKAGLKGNVTLNFGKECKYGELNISVSAFYEITATAKLCLKLGSLYAGAKASAAIGLESSVDFKTKQIPVAGRNFQIEVGVTLGVKGSATATAEAAAELGINTDMITSLDSIKLGELVTHKVGARAEAWAGVSASIEAHAHVYTDINNNSTKVVFGSLGLECGFGIGAKIGGMKSTSNLEEASNFYVKDALEIDITAIAGGKVKLSLGILKALVDAGGEKMKDACKNLLSSELRAEIIEALKECMKEFFKKVGDSIKASLTSAKMHIDASPLRSALISLQKLFASHNTVVNSQITKYDARYQLSRNSVVDSNEKYKKLISQNNMLKEEYNTLAKIFSNTRTLSPNQYETQYPVILGNLKAMAIKVKDSKELNILAKLDAESEKAVEQNKLLKAIGAASNDFKELIATQQKEAEEIKNKTAKYAENMKLHAQKFKDHMSEYQTSGLKDMQENFAELYSTMINLPSNPFDVSKDDKKAVQKHYEKINQNIALLERTIDRQINFIIDLNTIEIPSDFDANDLTVQLNIMLDQMEQINKQYDIIKDELTIFIK